MYADVLHILPLLYYRRCLFSVLELDVRYKWSLMPSKMYRSLFLVSHFSVYSILRHVTLKLMSYVDVQHIERLLYYQRYYLWCLDLY